MSLRMSSLVFLLLATLSFVRPARADSLSVVYNFLINSGSGDNAAGSISGPGTLIATGGGTGCNWCFVGTSFSPGTTLNASISFLDFGSYFTGVFKGTIIDPNNFSIGSTTLTAGSFTFPSVVNGGTFSVTVPASMGSINIFTGAQILPFQVAPGQLKLTFGFDDQQYFFEDGFYASTPEPQTLILFGSGLLVITAASFHRKFSERGSHRA
jgi:hypothetical protein